MKERPLRFRGLLLIPIFVALACSAGARADVTGGETLQAFELSDLVKMRRAGGDTWLEFLRVPALSMGLYVLAPGAEDTQTPHAEDEVYYVLSGRGVLNVDAVDRPVQPGSVLFVAKNATHRFHSITEEMTLMVFFAPAESSESDAPVD